MLKPGVDILQDSEIRRGKIELTIGNFSFAGEGDQDWLDQQVSRLIERIDLSEIDRSVGEVSSMSGTDLDEIVPTGSLPSYLRAKGAETVQVQKFLATAAWLGRRGEKDLTTGAVTRALRESQQRRLGNPADCLNQNVAKGFCEKNGNRFFITTEGWRHLGESAD